jgi:hypothetical protein
VYLKLNPSLFLFLTDWADGEDSCKVGSKEVRKESKSYIERIFCTFN